MNKKYSYLLVSILVVLLIIALVRIEKLSNTLADNTKTSDHLYKASLYKITSAMNYNYENLSEESRLFHFAQFYEAIGKVEMIYPSTSYYNNDAEYTLELAMKELKTYFHDQWINDFEIYSQTQLEIYNAVLDLGMSPEEDENIYNLYDTLMQYNN